MSQTTDTPILKRARYLAAGGDRAAIDRQQEKWQGELSTPGLTSKHRRDLERGIAVLEEAQWGDHPALMDRRHEGRQRRGNQRPRAQQHKPKPKPAAAPKRRTPTVTDHLSSAAGERFGQTGIPQATESTSRFIMHTLGGLVALSFLGLMLSKNGVRALQLGSNGLVYGLQALVSPHVDPLFATRKDRGLPAAGAQPNPYAFTRPLAAPTAPAMPTIGAGAHRPAPTVRYIVPTP